MTGSDPTGMLRRFENRTRNRGDKSADWHAGWKHWIDIEHSYRPPASQQKRRVPDV
jgi:hypothetical protein